VKRKALILLLAVISVGAMAWWYARARSTAAAEFPSDLLALVPNDASMLVYADVAALRDEPLVQRLAAMAPPGTTAKEYAEFVSATGFDYQRDLDRVLLTSFSASPAQTLVFADGRFDQEKIEAYALRSGTREQRNGHSVYSTPGATPGKTTAFTFLSPGRLVLADNGDLSAVLGDRTGAALDPALQEQVSRVAGAPLFLVAKPDALGAASSQAGFSAPLEGLRWVNLAARPEGDQVLLSAEGECDSPERAKQMATMLELMRGFLGGALADPKARGGLPAETAEAITRIFQAAQISTDASRVRLLVSLDPAAFGPVTRPTPPAAGQ
jgi:hypothetical protein